MYPGQKAWRWTDAGNVYIANIDNNYVRRADATGAMIIIAGNQETGL